MKNTVETRRAVVRGFPVAVTWRNGLVVEVSLGFRPGRNDLGLGRQIERVLRGGSVPKRLRFDTRSLSGFARRVLRVCAGIRPGELMTYSELARNVGSPGAARAVGQVMAKNPFPLLIPCHRVVGSNGKLGGFAGGTKMKRELLVREGRRDWTLGGQ